MGTLERGRITNRISMLNRLYVTQFPEMQVSLIGEKWGAGMEHTVHGYGINKDQALKIPHRIRHHPQTPEQKIADFNIIQKYFPENAIETKVLLSPDRCNYLLLQRRLIQFENITPYNIWEVQEQFLELIRRNQELVRQESMSLDFLGKAGIEACLKAHIKGSGVVPEISNIVIERRNGGVQLIIQDVAILKLGNKNKNDAKGTRDRLLFAITFGLNSRLISQHFGVSIS